MPAQSDEEVETYEPIDDDALHEVRGDTNDAVGGDGADEEMRYATPRNGASESRESMHAAGDTGRSATTCRQIEKHIARTEELARDARGDEGAGVVICDTEACEEAGRVASQPIAKACEQEQRPQHEQSRQATNKNKANSVEAAEPHEEDATSQGTQAQALPASREQQARAQAAATARDPGQQFRDDRSEKGDDVQSRRRALSTLGLCPCEREFRARQTCETVTWCPLHGPLNGGWHVIGYDSQQQEVLRWYTTPGATQYRVNARQRGHDREDEEHEATISGTSRSSEWWQYGKTIGARLWSAAQSTGCAALHFFGGGHGTVDALSRERSTGPGNCPP